MIIAVDFDGVLCQNKFPEIGAPNKAMLKYLYGRKLDGDKLILWTCRSGEDLDNAVEWCGKYGLRFDAINDNLQENIDMYHINSRKVYANVYIDDQNAPEWFMQEYRIPYQQGQSHLRRLSEYIE